ncbi:MAG: LUD domain-containing protein, partial [Phycisphaerales bacterium]
DDDDLLFDCEVGITDVDAAIAESGSLVVSTNGRIRNAWVTPPIHIAIVRAAQVLADLVDLFELRPDAIDAASTTIITGPSKTADIEGVLVTGVHGPAAVEIVLVD